MTGERDPGDGTGDDVVRVRALRKAYGDRAVLDGVDLRVGKGEIVGFVGPNGAGKTTCLRVLVGLVLRDAGDVTVCGLDPGPASLEVRRRCSYLPGETSVYRGMQAREFLEFALKFYPRRRTALIEEMTERFELPMRRPVRALSAGMKQKLALMTALAPEVGLYILDEPDRALDQSVRLVLRDLLLRLRDTGASVLLSSHHLAEVDAVCNRTEFLLGGRSVPKGFVDAARARLRGRLRFTATRKVDLPAGLDARRFDDGTVEIQGLDDPFALLADLPRDALDAVEIGATRLEDLYRELTR
jgi:ABC-2 type transport system ATP-binding protein